MEGCGVFYCMKRITLFIFLITLAGCSQHPLVRETRILMDTFAEISCFDADKDKAIKAMDEAFKEMKRIEKVFSKFDEKSEISRINKSAGLEEVSTTEEVIGLIERSIYYSKISDGAFDITIAPLMEIWGFVHKNNFIPDKKTIEEALKKVSYENIVLDTQRLTIHFLHKDTKIDLGGIAKGYAVDRAKEVFLSYGIKNCLINLGGNIFALDSAPGNRNWHIGIRDPKDKNKILKTLYLKGQAVSTSGNYERFVVLDGKRYSHIISPVTGMPVQGIMSVTVVADSGELADALSTAIFVMQEKKTLEFIKSIKGIEVLIVKEDGKKIEYP